MSLKRSGSEEFGYLPAELVGYKADDTYVKWSVHAIKPDGTDSISYYDSEYAARQFVANLCKNFSSQYSNWKIDARPDNAGGSDVWTMIDSGTVTPPEVAKPSILPLVAAVGALAITGLSVGLMLYLKNSKSSKKVAGGS